jgi:hypothetical protein
VTAFASDLDLTRSGIFTRFATVFLARIHCTGAGNVCAGILLSCHSPCSIQNNEQNARHYSPRAEKGVSNLKACAQTGEIALAPTASHHRLGCWSGTGTGFESVAGLEFDSGSLGAVFEFGSTAVVAAVPVAIAFDLIALDVIVLEVMALSGFSK